MKTSVLHEAKNTVLILLGILSAGMGLHGFLLSSRFIDGGVTGVSMLLAKVTRAAAAGADPGDQPALHRAGLPPDRPRLRDPQRGGDRRVVGLPGHDPLPRRHARQAAHRRLRRLLHRRGDGPGDARGAVLDGTDIAALLISKRSHLFRVGDVILGLNIVIFLTAAFFLGVDPALYSILTYVAASKTLDFLLHGIEEYTAITIISEQSDADPPGDHSASWAGASPSTRGAAG